MTQIHDINEAQNEDEEKRYEVKKVEKKRDESDLLRDVKRYAERVAEDLPPEVAATFAGLVNKVGQRAFESGFDTALELFDTMTNNPTSDDEAHQKGIELIKEGLKHIEAGKHTVFQTHRNSTATRIGPTVADAIIARAGIENTPQATRVTKIASSIEGEVGSKGKVKIEEVNDGE